MLFRVFFSPSDFSFNAWSSARALSRALVDSLACLYASALPALLCSSPAPAAVAQSLIPQPDCYVFVVLYFPTIKTVQYSKVPA
jgi:hypothetical protein